MNIMHARSQTTPIRSRIQDEFTGFDDGAVFRLDNGQVWQQARYRYRYHYSYRPEVEIRQEVGGFVMCVPCMDDTIEVVPVSIVTEGVIISDFKGFDGQSEFTFDNGQTWKQAKYKYAYHYAYRPSAIVVNGIDGLVLKVEGMDETVAVRRVR